MLRIGYFEGFRGENAILIAGDAVGLRELAELLRSLEDAAASPVRIHKLPSIDVRGSVELTAFAVGEERGVRRVDERSGTMRFEWHHSPEGWLESGDKIESVAASPGPSHNYLDSPLSREDATVVVSKGEYDDTWSQVHASGNKVARGPS